VIAAFPQADDWWNNGIAGKQVQKQVEVSPIESLERGRERQSP